MKTVTAKQLYGAYIELYPTEAAPPNDSDPYGPYRGWLARYRDSGGQCVATQNWGGKVTRALFRALKLKQPRTKRDMLTALS